MKKRICFIFTLTLVLVVLNAPAVFAAPAEIFVTVDGEQVYFADQRPIAVDGRMLVPLRAVFEHIGFRVRWDRPTATLTRGEDIVQISLGSAVFFANGEPRELDVPAQAIGGSAMLPIRAVLESVGYTVRWDRPANTVRIFSPVPRIPNRRLTDAEIAEWIYAYNAIGVLEAEREIIRLTNIEREAAGLSALTEYEPLMMAARFKAQSLSDLDYWSHTSPVYGNFANISREVFGVPPRAMAENLAHSQRTPEAAISAWMNSPGHRANMLNPNYSRIGTGFYNGRWVQKFSS